MINITTQPDMNIEPGHQVLILPYSENGRALARLLTGVDAVWHNYDGNVIRIPHDAIVDARIVQLIDQLAHVRFSAPDLIQMTLEEPA